MDASTGNISTVAGVLGSSGYSGDGGPATSAKLNNPAGVTIDSLGNIFIADRFNHVVRKVDSSTGNISTVAGTGSKGSTGDGGPAASAQQDNPFRIAVDSSGSIIVADALNHAIRKVGVAAVAPPPVPSMSAWALAILAGVFLLTFSDRVRRRIMRRADA